MKRITPVTLLSCLTTVIAAMFCAMMGVYSIGATRDEWLRNDPGSAFSSLLAIGAYGWGCWKLIRYACRAFDVPRVAGVCQWCGYDLRATPERCPECGAVPG